MITDTITAYKNKASFKLTGVVHLKPQGHLKGSVLLSYITNPFLLAPNERMSPSHTAPWECKKIAELFLERGFAVDVIDHNNTTFIPKKSYTFCFDIHQNLERLSPLLNKDCIKIFHIVSCYPAFQNAAEQKRLDDLKARTGATLQAHRYMKSSESITFADYVSGLGTEETFSTYAFAHKKITQIPISTTVLYDSPEHKDFEKTKKNFIWLGGGGMVHKGLDLVPETFRDLPDFNLTVCGPIHAEKDFAQLYKKELFETPNIKTLGKIDISSPTFKDSIENSVALIYPSCSEGQSGGVVTCMHAGLIPIVSKESGVHVENFGITLNESSLQEIKQAIETISALPAQELKNKAVSTWQYAREHHTRETFTKAYTNFIDGMMKERNL